MKVEQKQALDLLDTSKQPALSTTSDMPVVETVPDAQNEGAPPTKPEAETKAAPAKGDTDASKTNSESATEQTDEHSGEPAEGKKPPRGVQKKLDELTRREAEALRLFEAERQEKLRILALLEKGPVREETKAEPAKQEEVEPVRPKRSEFQDPDQYEAAVDEYIAAKSSFIARKEFREARAADKQEAEKRLAEESQRKIQQDFEARREKAKTRYQDFDEVSNAPDVMVSGPVANTIMTHEMGPDLGYYLGKHREEAKRIFNLPMDQQLMEVGLIFAGLKSQETVKADPAPVVKPSLTQAPKPIKPLGAGSETSGSRSLEDMTPEEYANEWKKRPENQRRSGMRH